MIVTGTSNETLFTSIGKWKGKDICVTNPTQIEPCPVEGHALEIVHHYGDKGEHYCPTGFLMCPLCGGLADEPQPYSCLKWGIK